MRHIRRMTVLAGIGAIFLAACAREADKPVRTTENGVETVTNRLTPYVVKNEPGSFSLREEAVLDLEREDLAAKGLTQPRGFDVGPKGEMIILSEAGIFVFDAAGGFLRQFGRLGQGPGEYQNPGLIRVLDSGELAFYDGGADKFLFWSLDGALLREVKNTSKVRMFGPNGALCLDRGGYLFEEMDFDPARSALEYHLTVADADFQKKARLAESVTKENPLKSNRYNLFDGYVKYVISGGRIYAASQGAPEFEVNVYDTTGRRLRSIRKEWRKVSIPQSYKDKALGSGEGPIAAMLNEKGYFPESFPAVRELFADGRGRVFVETYETGPVAGESLLAVFAPDGTFIGEQPIAPAQARFIKGDRLYALVEKESGFQKLIVYKMIWGGAGK
ncbi:MAG: 6-bladed beta-propeller [Acidobacteriota bacterium]|nr:6-bladed beta-propeller [Acidobacteriota bacterium]